MFPRVPRSWAPWAFVCDAFGVKQSTTKKFMGFAWLPTPINIEPESFYSLVIAARAQKLTQRTYERLPKTSQTATLLRFAR